MSSTPTLVSQRNVVENTGWPIKVSHYQMIKMYYIILKPVNVIRYILKSKYESSTIILFVGIRHSMHDLLFDLSNYA